MNNKLRTTNLGFSLIELILYVAIFMIFITGVVTIGVQTILVGSKARVQQEVISNMRYATRRIAFEVRNASAINAVTGTSISLANSDVARNPTIIAKSGSRITIGWGASGSCPTSSPCFLTSSGVSVAKLEFTDMGDAGNLSDSVKYALTINKVNAGGRSEWNYSQSSVGNAELRGK